MIRYIKLLTCMVCGMWLTASCSDYLQESPKNALSTDNFYQTEAQMEQALNGLYGTLKPLPQYIFAMSEYRGDNTWVTDERQDAYLDVATFNSDGLKTDGLIANCWADYYKVVAAANVFLDKIEEMTFSDDDTYRPQYTAEARFLRALAYFDLVRFYGRVPAPTHTLGVNGAFSTPQSETADVYNDVIVPDLQYAVEHLMPSAKDYKGTVRTERVTQMAAKALLGKVYLTMAGYPVKDSSKKPLATELFKEVIDYAEANNKYWAATMDAWNKMWLHENDNKYFIFEIQYVDEKDMGNPMVPISVPSQSNNDFCNRNLVNGNHVYIGKDLQLDHFVLKDETTGQYLDQRITNTMNLVETLDEDGNIVAGTGNTFYVKFFENKKKRAALGVSDMDASIVDRTYWPQNFPVLRLEDIMLLYAECVGNTTEGRRMVNKIRTRAGLPELSASLSESEFQQAVADERRYELAEEGHRWFDLVRYGEDTDGELIFVKTMQKMFNTYGEGAYAKYASRVKAYTYLYPIPLSQIEIRAGLYTQNEGY